MNTVQVPQLSGMDESHRKALVSMAQSIQPAIENAAKTAAAAASSNSQQLASLAKQISQIAAAVVALTTRVNNLPTGGSGATQRTFGFFSG